MSIRNLLAWLCLALAVFGAAGCTSKNASPAPAPDLSSPPTIVTQPATQTVMVGQTVTFTVIVAGTAPMNYQWRRKGAAISGATTVSYTTPPVQAADNGAAFDVIVTNSVGSATSNAASLTVKATAAVTLSNLTETYDGTSKAATAATTPSGLTITFSYTGAGGTTYGPSVTAPANAGSYSVTATVSDPVYSGSASGTMTITKGAATVLFGGTTQTCDGTPKAVSATTIPGNLSVTLSYSGTGATAYGPSANAPSNAGTYAVTATISDTNYSGSAVGTLTINKGAATVALSGLTQTYDGTPKAAVASTSPSGLAVSFSYAGTGGTTYGPSSNAPASVGSYAVIVTVGDSNYNGSGTGTLAITKGTAIVTLGGLTQNYDGTPKAVTCPTIPSNLATTISYSGTGTTTYAASGTAPTNVGTYSIIATVSDPNYSGSASGTLVISKANSVITWATPTSITYGTALSATQLNASANVPGTFLYSPTTGAVLNVGNQPLSVTFTPTDTANYTTAIGNATLAVNKAIAVVTWPTPATITYGTALSATQLDASATGVGGITLPGTFVYTPALGAVPGSGNQPLSATFTPTDTINYATATANVTLTVNRGSPAIVWTTPAAIAYGTALSAAQLDATATGTGGSSLPGIFVYTPATGAVLSASSQLLSVTFTPTDAVNYTIVSGNVTLTVNKDTPAITWATPAAITYGTALTAAQLNAAATGVGGNSLPGNFVYTSATGAVLAAGSQPLSATFTPTDFTDYTTALGNVTLAVNKATPTITWPTPAAITYGTVLSATQLNATANVPGTFLYTPAAGTVLAAGNQSLSVTFTPTDTTDYATATGNVILAVNKATPAVTWATPAAITYGAALTATQLNATANVLGTFVYTPAVGAVLTAGSQPLSVTFTPTDTTDYTTASSNVALAVNKATPAITWTTPAAITYGTALSAAQLNASATGVGGSTLPGTSVYAPAAGVVLAAGSQPLSVTFTPTDSNDYTTATGNVTLAINKATPTITWGTPAAITYGTALSATQLNATANVAGTFVYAPAMAVVLAAGSQPLSVTFTPTDATDYATATGNVTLTVTKAAAVVTWTTPAAITYGAALSATQLNATANVPGTFVYAPAVGAVLTAGGQTLSATFTPTDATDFTTGTANVVLTVNKATPSITWTTPATITYGTALSITQLDATAKGAGGSVLPGTFVYAPVAGTVLAVGTQPLSVTFTPTDAIDYTTAAGNVTLTINKATAAISLGHLTQTYDGTPKAASVATTPSNLTVTFSYTGISGTSYGPSAVAPTAAGMYSVTATVVDSSYQGSASGTLTVNMPPAISTQPASQTVMAGQTATFMVALTGSVPLTYQWRKNGVNIPGASGSSYTTPATTIADNSATFGVVITNIAGGVTSSAAILTVDAPPTMTTPPAAQSIVAGRTATFMVSATGSIPLTYQWQKNGVNIPSATGSSYTTPTTTISDDGEQFSVVVGNTFGVATSNGVTLTVNPLTTVDVATYHNDNSRTGQNLNETVLTPFNVQSNTFGKLGFFAVDGRVDAQPLFLSNVAIPGMGTHDVVYVVTEHDSVYAFDAVTGGILWQASVLASGETPSDNRGCSQVTPEIGITATPVIDRAAGPNGVIYLVAMSKDGSGHYFQRLHALDIATHAELFAGPATIQATYPGHGADSNGPSVVFDPAQYKERAALLLLNGVVYTSWASHCDNQPYTGWIMGFSETTLAATKVLNLTPNGNGGAVWMSGGGPAADSDGYIYLLDGNGTFDTTFDTSGFPISGDYGNAFLKLSPQTGLGVRDYFQMSNQAIENGSDLDFGSGGVLVLPDLTDGLGTVRHLAVGAGKDKNIYVVDRNSLGQFNPTKNNIYQEIDGIFPGTGTQVGIYSTPAYFNNNLYFGSAGNPIMAFGISNALISTTAASHTSTTYEYPGATPAISANGNSNGILWAVENGSTTAILHAYDATNLASELYNSGQASGARDQFGAGNKFITPTIANGRVYVGAPNGVAVFGLLPSYTATIPLPTITQEPANQTVNVGQSAVFTVGTLSASPNAFVQKNDAYFGNSAGAATESLAFSSNVTVGNLIFVEVGWEVSDGTISSITDSIGNTYTALPSIVNGGNQSKAFYAFSTASGADTIAVKFTNTGSYVGMLLAEYSGVTQIDTHNEGIGNSNAIASPAITPSTNGELLTGYADANNNAWGAGGAFTQRTTALARRGSIEDKLNAGLSSVTSNFTLQFGASYESGIVAFKSANVGPAPIYQWQANGANIPGATASIYTTPALAASANGAIIDVVVSNTAGSVTSTTALLTVNTPPSITVAPANQSIVAGETATFSVGSSGAAPLTYQWQQNGVNIPNAISAIYTTPITTLANNGALFSVVVTNALGSVTSATATLTVSQPASPATYYIDPYNGNDALSAISKATPWRHAPGMAGCIYNCNTVVLNPGDRVIFLGGAVWSVDNFPLVVRSSGTAANPIYYGVDPTWYLGSSWTRPVFELGNITWNQAPIEAISASYVTFDNFEIRNEEINNKGIWPPLGSIAISGGTNVTVQNSYIHGWSIAMPQAGSDSLPSGGIVFYNGATGGVVKNSVFDAAPESNSGTAIYGAQIVQGNVIQNTPNAILVSQSGADVSGNQVFDLPYSVDPTVTSNAIVVNESGNVYNNIVHDLVPGISAIYLQSGWNGAGNTQNIYNNLVWNSGDEAPITIDSSGMEPSLTSNQVIVNNTLSSGPNPCVQVVPRYDLSTNITVQNNHCISDQPASQVLCLNNAGGSFDCGLVSNVTVGNNVIMSTATASSQGYLIGNGFQPSISNAGTVGAGLNLDPECAAIGTPLCSDRLSLARPNGAVWDAGAYLYQASSTAPPSIVTQPAWQAAAIGQTATFNVEAIGAPTLTYQWQRNGVAIPGATSTSYTTPTISSADNGALFTVVVSNGFGSVSSGPAPLLTNTSAGHLSGSASGLTFGNVSIGLSNTMSVTFTNTSAFYVNILNVSLAGAGFSASGVESGLTIAPGESEILNVTFAPAGIANVTGSITITSDAENSPATVSLSGSGVLPPHAVTIGWTAASPAPFGYNVYRATNPLGPYTELNATPLVTTSFTDITVLPGQTYMYWVTTIDADTVQSVFVGPALATVPTP